MFSEYKDILTPADVAKALGIGKNTVYKLIEEHAIGSRRIRRKIIIPKVCLIDYAQSARYTVAKP